MKILLQIKPPPIGVCIQEYNTVGKKTLKNNNSFSDLFIGTSEQVLLNVAQILLMLTCSILLMV